MNERDTIFFRPLWRRVLVAAVCVVWFGFEIFYSHDQFWMVLSGLAVAYSVWNFFLAFSKDPKPTGGPTDGPAPPTQQ
ncbi:MAG: DUF3329 domain-containing protein [Devosia sp.]